MSIDAGALRNVVERFVAAAAQPAVLDPGEEPLRLLAEQWSLTEWNGRLVLQAWNGDRNLVRKVTGLREERRDRLALTIERFPKAKGELQIADLAAPLGQELERRSSRAAFRERFGLMLAREFPEWHMEEISSDANLEQSLSPSYVRAMLRKGSMAMAVMGAPLDALGCGGLVPFGVIWLEYLRGRDRALNVGRLILFAPVHREKEVS
ncbi:MAG TPA: hypothetical protein VNH18_32215, partial [Bryobacteraceae bacterium]|nr:hypothetical protein [Bryobacteraceae bacterium]